MYKIDRRGPKIVLYDRPNQNLRQISHKYDYKQKKLGNITGSSLKYIYSISSTTALTKYFYL